MLFSAVVQYTDSHFVSGCDREFCDAGAVKFRTQAPLWIETQILCRFCGFAGFHLITSENSMAQIVRFTRNIHSGTGDTECGEIGGGSGKAVTSVLY